MAVAATAGMLRTLHRMHRQLADLAEQLLAGPRAVTARNRQVQAAEGKKAAAAEDVKRARMAADQKQLQLKSSETKLRDLTAKLNACKTNREYQTLTGVAQKQSVRDLNELVAAQLLQRQGNGRATCYVLPAGPGDS